MILFRTTKLQIKKKNKKTQKANNKKTKQIKQKKPQAFIHNIIKI